MSIDIKTTSINPVRRTFDHLIERVGPNKNPSRYLEATIGIQPKLNFHYRPTWQPDKRLYDPTRTAIVMNDFDDLLDPRQYYYGTWTIQRSKQQESQEKNFSFVEDRELLANLSGEWQDKVRKLVIPLRHVAWGANVNNSFIAAYGFGAPMTSAASLQMCDHLGAAQYISRIGLILDNNDPAGLDAAKQAWLDAPMWQPMRALVEESMVAKDWFELHLLQNFLIDGSVYPLVFERFDAELARNGGGALAMLTEFMVDWFSEASRWTDAVIKIAAAESADNKGQFEAWRAAWTPKVQGALKPLADYAFGDKGAAELDEIMDRLTARAKKIGLNA